MNKGSTLFGKVILILCVVCLGIHGQHVQPLDNLVPHRDGHFTDIEKHNQRATTNDAQPHLDGTYSNIGTPSHAVQALDSWKSPPLTQAKSRPGLLNWDALMMSPSVNHMMHSSISSTLVGPGIPQDSVRVIEDPATDAGIPQGSVRVIGDPAIDAGIPQDSVRVIGDPATDPGIPQDSVRVIGDPATDAGIPQDSIPVIEDPEIDPVNIPLDRHISSVVPVGKSHGENYVSVKDNFVGKMSQGYSTGAITSVNPGHNVVSPNYQEPIVAGQNVHPIDIGQNMEPFNVEPLEIWQAVHQQNVRPISSGTTPWHEFSDTRSNHPVDMQTTLVTDSERLSADVINVNAEHHLSPMNGRLLGVGADHGTRPIDGDQKTPLDGKPMDLQTGTLDFGLDSSVVGNNDQQTPDINSNSKKPLNNAWNTNVDMWSLNQHDNNMWNADDSPSKRVRILPVPVANSPMKDDSPDNSFVSPGQDKTSLKEHLITNSLPDPLINIADVDPLLLSQTKTNPAEMIDFLIAREMSKDPAGTVFQPFESLQDHKDPIKADKLELLVPNIILKESTAPTILAGEVAPVDMELGLEHQSGKVAKSLKKEQRKLLKAHHKQEKQQQRQLNKTLRQQQRLEKQQLNKTVRQQQRVERKQQKQVAKQQRKATRKALRQEKKRRLFSEKLALRKQRKIERLQAKIEKHIQKIEAIDNSKGTQAVQTHVSSSAGETLNVNTNNKVSNNEHISTLTIVRAGNIGRRNIKGKDTEKPSKKINKRKIQKL